MINNLLFLSLAPVLIIALYIYSKDKYEKEPLGVLLKAILVGVAIVLPVVIIEKLLAIPAEKLEGLTSAAYTAFVIAGFTEEGMKFLAFYLVFWKNRNFNEKFDGIVYSVYIALGFAAIENLLYVFTGGYGVGFIRAITAVPAHALFGIMMGYYFSMAKFGTSKKTWRLTLAFILPFLFHGLYDFLLMSKSTFLLSLFIPVFIYFWILGFRRISLLSNASSFRTTSEGKGDPDFEQ